MNKKEFFNRVTGYIKGYYEGFFKCFGSEFHEAFEAFKIVLIYLCIIGVFLLSPILVPIVSIIEVYRECREEKKSATIVKTKQ